MSASPLLSAVKKGASSEAMSGLVTIVLSSLVVAALYFGKEFLVPLALAALLTLMLSPLVSRIERYIGRAPAVIIVTVLIFMALGSLGWVITRQAAALITQLPDYRSNIERKLHSLEPAKDGPIKRFSQMVVDIEAEVPVLGSGTPEPQAEQTPPPAPAKNSTPAPAPARAPPPAANPLAEVRWLASPFLDMLATAGIVTVLAIFMLLKREDMRGRIIKIIGRGRISSTSRAMEDAGNRVWRYLFTQLCVNVAFGSIVGTILYVIGVPTALLWGALATVLRFIPYIGIWVAAFCPIAISIAASPGWHLFFYTCGLFFGMELVTSNFIEPFIYRSSTGVSSLALVVAAIFWTWLWGPIGLLLSTPMTVCMAVMGKHIPRLSFFRTLLGDEEPLSPGEECYHRLLVGGFSDSGDILDTWMKTNSLTALFDEVLIPTVKMAELDFHREELEESKRARVLQGVRDIIEDLDSRPSVEAKAETSAVSHRIVCLPARGESDEISGAMLVHLLKHHGHDAYLAPAIDVSITMASRIEERSADIAFVSVIPPSTVIHARHLCSRLRARFPKLTIMVGVWGTVDNIEEVAKGLRVGGADQIVSSMAEALVQVDHPVSR